MDDMTSAITKEERELARRHFMPGVMREHNGVMHKGGVIEAYEAALTASEAEVERLKAALEPFKIVGDLIERQRASGTFDREDEEPFNSGMAWTKDGQKRTLTWGDFRRARAALTGEKP